MLADLPRPLYNLNGSTKQELETVTCAFCGEVVVVTISRSKRFYNYIKEEGGEGGGGGVQK